MPLPSPPALRRLLTTPALLATATLLAGCSTCLMIDSCAVHGGGGSGSHVPEWHLLPPVDRSYHWVRLKDAALYRPDGWRATAGSEDLRGYAVETLALEPEDIGASSARIRLRAMPGFSRQFGVRPSAGADVLLHKLRSEKSESDLLAQEVAGDGRRTMVRFRDEVPGQAPRIVYRILLADDAYNTLYDLTIEAPVAEWKPFWQRHGEAVVRSLRLIE